MKIKKPKVKYQLSKIRSMIENNIEDKEEIDKFVEKEIKEIVG